MKPIPYIESIRKIVSSKQKPEKKIKIIALLISSEKIELCEQCLIEYLKDQDEEMCK